MKKADSADPAKYLPVLQKSISQARREGFLSMKKATARTPK